MHSPTVVLAFLFVKASLRIAFRGGQLNGKG